MKVSLYKIPKKYRRTLARGKNEIIVLVIRAFLQSTLCVALGRFRRGDLDQTISARGILLVAFPAADIHLMVVCCLFFFLVNPLAGSGPLVSVLILRHRENLDSNLEKVKGAVWYAPHS